jgi:abortive infection bacteriophage resistance protein
VTSPDSTYAKPFLTVPGQIRRLQERGMDCGTASFASGVLERYGYYRLSGFWHLYRARPNPPAPQFDDDGREIRLDSFVQGTSLSHVVSLYDFDHALRTRLSDVLSTIEISFRFFIGHRLGKVDKFAHRNPETLGAVREQGGIIETTTAYCEWLEEYDRHENRARDGFVLHFREKYGPHLPIWVATEVMSLGVLSNLYTLMRQVDQEILAARFQINTADGRGDRGALANWLNNVRNVRNICAHYGRLWNRTFDVLIDAPGQSRKDADSHLSRLVDEGINNKLYGVLLIMRHLLLSIAPERTDVIEIANYIDSQSQDVQFNLRQLGFPDDWRTDAVWDHEFTLDPAPMMAASLLDRTESLTAAETRAALVGAEVTESEHPRSAEQEVRAKNAAQRKLLKTYLRYNVVIEVQIGGAKYYPAFQFRNGKIIEPLAEINKSFAAQCADAHPAQVAAALLDWWQTPQENLPKTADGSTQSPLDLLDSVAETEFSVAVSAAGVMSQFVVPEPWL